jgi:hypothetical protein
MTPDQLLKTIALRGELSTLILNADNPDGLLFMARAFAGEAFTDDHHRQLCYAAAIVRARRDCINPGVIQAAQDIASCLGDLRTCPALRTAAAMNPELSRDGFVLAATLIGVNPGTARIQWGNAFRESGCQWGLPAKP